MECTIQSMAPGEGASGQQDPATIPSGKVGQVCREWLVREDGVLAYQLQNEEISKHYEGNRNKNQVVRSDLHQAKSLQEYEYQEMMRRYQEELEKQLEHDARIAAQIQEQENRARDSTKSGLQRQESIVERDRLIAERLQAKEKVKSLKYKLLKEKRQVERVASGNGFSTGSNPGTNSPAGDTHSNHSNDSGGARGRRDIVDISDLTEFCIKPPDDLTEEEKRIFLEEQDAELARFLQKQEAARNMAKDTTKNVIESHDAEIARILQEQEKVKARKLREKARLRALQRQQQHEQQASNNHSHHQSNSNRVHSSNDVQSHHHKQVQSNSVQVHSSSTHSPSYAAHRPPSSGSSSHSPSSHNGSQGAGLISVHPHSSHRHQHHNNPSVPSQSSQSSHSCQSNPLRNKNGSNSPHLNNNVVTSSAHCHTSNFDPTTTTFPDGDDEECYDDDNPIVDRYYPVGDDLKRMNHRSQDQDRYPSPGGGRSMAVAKGSSNDLPNSNFHNIAMDLDPTYNRSAASNSPSGGQNSGHSNGQPEMDINGQYFAQFCRVSPTITSDEYAVRTRNKSPEINPAILPVPGHRRQEKSKRNRKMADGCKQQ